ncbi:MAG: hypothetical protein ACYSUF_14030 [Planctomycetota bacterium]|jgi:recombination protein RecR
MTDTSRKPTSSPEPVERLIDELTELPGIGRRSAERVAFHLLKATTEKAMRLSQAIADVKNNVSAGSARTPAATRRRCW